MILFEFDKKIMNWLDKLNREAKEAERKRDSQPQDENNDFSGESVILMTGLAVAFFVFDRILRMKQS